MKRLLSFVMCFLLGVSMVSAAEESAGVAPDSILHGLDLALEKVRLVFTFSNAKRAELHLKYAAERLAEAKAMVGKRDDLVEKSIGRYTSELGETETELETAKARGENIENVALRVDKASKNNVAVLTELLEKVPETAKKGIQNALEKSQKGREKALEAIGKAVKKEEKKEETTEETKEEVKDKKAEEKAAETEEKKETAEEKKEETPAAKKSAVDATKFYYTIKKFSDHAEIFGKVNGRDVKFRIEGDQYTSDATLKLRIVREVQQQYGYDEEDAQNAMANAKFEQGTKSEIALVKKKKSD